MTTIKNISEGKKKTLKILIGFLSANKIDNYNRVGVKREKNEKRKKNPKGSTRQVKK